MKRARFGVPGLIAAIPPLYRVPLVICSGIVTVGFFLILAWYVYIVLVILEGDTLISLPFIGTQFTQSVIPIGAILFVIAEVLNLPQIWREATGQVEVLRYE